MSFFHKKRASTKANAANVHMTEAETALAQSDFNIDKILDIQNKFTGGTALLVPGRIFIREGMLWKVCRKGPKKRHFFLFNDVLVYGSVVAGRYSNQHVLPLALMEVSGDPSYQPEVNTTFNNDSLDEQLDIHNAFQISHADKSFHVFSLSQADKANWLANLQKHINKVALVGGNQSVTPRAVWVPDSHSKECMICGQKFTAFNRKHHCRQCGRVVCSTCSPHRVIIEGQTDGKPERVCGGCVKETTVVKSKGSPEVTPKPPSAAVAAQVVSNVLRQNSLHRSPSNQPSSQSTQQRVDSSTDTEDSDDSEQEEDTTPKKPTPVPRRPQPEVTQHTSSARSPVGTPPKRPPPYNSIKRPSQPQPAAATAELPKPKPRQRKPELSEEGVSASVGEGKEGEGREVTGGEEGGGEVVVKGEGKVGEGVTDEAQPTPPPRKRKKAKLKQQLEQQLQTKVQSVNQLSSTTSQTSREEGEGEGERFGKGDGEKKGEEAGEGVSKEGEGEGGDEGEREAEGEGETKEVREGEQVVGEEVGETEGVEVVEAVEIEGDGEIAAADCEEEGGEEVEIVGGDEVEEEEEEEEEGGVEVVAAITGEEREEEGDKGAPKRPRRRRKHFGEQDASSDTIPDSQEDVSHADSAHQQDVSHTDSAHQQDVSHTDSAHQQGVSHADSAHQQEVSHTDSAHQQEVSHTDSACQQDDPLADREPNLTQEGSASPMATDQSEVTQRETVETESETTGQPEQVSGHPSVISGQPVSETAEDENPVKKPRGRRPKFKAADQES